METESNDSRKHQLASGITAAVLVGAISGCGIRRRLESLDSTQKIVWMPPPSDPNIVRVVNRVSFGPWPGDLHDAACKGVGGYLEEQLGAELPEDSAVKWRVDGLDVQQDVQDSPDVLSSLPDDQLLTEVQQVQLLRAVYSTNQLAEVMSDFWENHFNIYALKNAARQRIPVEMETAIRPNILGSFENMLLAVAHSPAMLAYLDNNHNQAGTFQRVNENYARELLELHTLGVHSGYSQVDIHQVARCLTGWTVSGGFKQWQFEFDPSWHDDGTKFIPFLNLHLESNGGVHDGEAVLHRLAHHPATATHLAQQLCMKFLGIAHPEVVESASRAYLRSNTSIKEMLRPILLDGLTRGDRCAPVFKRPLDLLVSSLRVGAADSDCAGGVQDHLSTMGQPLFQWPMPDGYPESAAAWKSTLLPRWNFASALAGARIAGTTWKLRDCLTTASAAGGDEAVSRLAEAVCGVPASMPTMQPLVSTLRDHARAAERSGVSEVDTITEVTALLIASPIYQWK